MRTRSDIINLLEQNRKSIKNFGVRELGVLGSFAREEQTAASDVDVLVDLEHKTFDSYMNLLFFLEDLFDSKVDLVMKDTIKKVGRYVSGMTFEQFSADKKTADAVVRNLEIIANRNEIDWKRISRFRDIVVHHYFKVDLEVVWDITQHRVNEARSCC